MKMKPGCWVIAGLVVLAGCHTASTRRETAQKPPVAVPSNGVMSATLAVPTKRDSKTEVIQAAASSESNSDVQTADVNPVTETEATPDSAALWKLTLDDAINAALARNPDLATARGTESVSNAALGVARTYPFNPQYQTQTTPYNKTTSGDNLPVNNQHAILQTFELAGQQRHREAAGEATLNQTRWTIGQIQLLTIATTERLFFAALFQREARDVTRSVLALNEEMQEVIGRRFRAGQATAADVAQARLDHRLARRQAELAEANFQTALLDLTRHLNWPPETPLDLAGSLLDYEWSPVASVSADEASGDGAASEGPIDVEVASLIAQRPDLQAARSDVDLARENLHLAQANRRPNLQIGPFYERDNDANSLLGFKGAINIPVVDTGKPLVQQRRAEFMQRQNVLQQLTEKALADARAATRRYERARRIVERSRGDFGDSFPDELRQIEAQFKAGNVDILRLFTARTSLIQDRRAYLDELNELGQAAAAVTAATGLPPSQLVSGSHRVPPLPPASGEPSP